MKPEKNFSRHVMIGRKASPETTPFRLSSSLQRLKHSRFDIHPIPNLYSKCPWNSNQGPS